MGDHFYNTARLAAAELKSAIEHAKSQEDAILLLFTHHYFWTASPSVVLQATRLHGKRWPITSIRRAMTNLAKDGKLQKTDHQLAGPYGMPEHIWQLPAATGENQ